MPNNLPLNWCECKFEDVLDYEQPTRYIVSNTDYQEQGIAVLTAGKSFILGYTDEKDGIFDASKETVIIFDDFTTASKLVDFPFKVKSSAMKILHAKKDININFLYYLMQTIHYESDTHKRYWISEYAKQTLNLPPLAEQERIVAKIEALFQGIDEGVERLKSAQAQIKQYRQSVLKSAFEGKLYKTTDWKETTFKDLLASDKYSMKRGPFGSSLKKEYFTNHGIRVFEQYNPINDDPYWKRYYITKEKYEELKAFEAKAGDLLISCSGVTLGRIVELPKDVETGIINQALLKLTLNNKKVINSYFIHLFRSPMFQQKIFSQARGAAIQNMLSVSEIKKIPLYLPTLPEQQRIVEEIEKRFAVADELEKAVNAGLEKADKLKQSILKKAFEGKLAPQNPNDEPASVLLDRIKKEQIPTKGKKK